MGRGHSQQAAAEPRHGSRVGIAWGKKPFLPGAGSQRGLTAVPRLRGLARAGPGAAAGGDDQRPSVGEGTAHRQRVRVLGQLALVGEGVTDGAILSHLQGGSSSVVGHSYTQHSPNYPSASDGPAPSPPGSSKELNRAIPSYPELQGKFPVTALPAESSSYLSLSWARGNFQLPQCQWKLFLIAPTSRECNGAGICSYPIASRDHSQLLPCRRGFCGAGSLLLHGWGGGMLSLGMPHLLSLDGDMAVGGGHHDVGGLELADISHHLVGVTLGTHPGAQAAGAYGTRGTCGHWGFAGHRDGGHSAQGLGHWGV